MQLEQLKNIYKAIELGIDDYGFSDHAPMNYDPKYRMDISKEIYMKNGY